MADVFDAPQARRLFAFIAAGASVGGLVGRGKRAVGRRARAVRADAAGGAAPASRGGAQALPDVTARGKRRRSASAEHAESPKRPVGGNPFSGLTRVLRSRYLLGVAVFVLLLTTASTFLYFEQARTVAELFPDRVEQVRVFGAIDFVVQAGALLSQLFITGRIAQRLGVRVLLPPCRRWSVGLRRVGAGADLRRAGGGDDRAPDRRVRLRPPGREMLFAPLDAQSKYKAKNFIDTVVYRGGDALSGWARACSTASATAPGWWPWWAPSAPRSGAWWAGLSAAGRS